MRMTSVAPALPTRSPPDSANITLWPSCVCSWPSSAAVSTSTIESSRLAGTSLPKLTTAVPLAVSDSVLSVSSVRAVSVSLAAVANPSSSTVRLVADHQARNRIRPQIDRHRRRRRVAVLVGDRVQERIEPFLARRRRVGEGAVRRYRPPCPWRPPSSAQPPSAGSTPSAPARSLVSAVMIRSGVPSVHRKRCRHCSPAARRRRS